jgi:hypothetical protein
MDIVEQKNSAAWMGSVFHISQMNQMKQFVSFVSSSTIIKNKDWRKLMETYWAVSDSWAVGGILIYFYKACMLFSKDTKSEFYRYKSNLKGVIKALLSINPDKRVDCLEALSMLDLNRWIAAATGRDNKLFAPVPDIAAKALAFGTGWLPGAPITADQYKMLAKDNVVSGANGLDSFGIVATPMDAVAHDWLTLYRKHGRFSGTVAA